MPYSFRSLTHLASFLCRGPVLSTAFGLGGDICFSGSTDCMIRVWRLPEDSGEDPFESYGKEERRTY